MKNKGGILIPLNTREASLKRRLRAHLSSLGFSRTRDGNLKAPGTSKEIIRELHSAQRADLIESQSVFITKNLPKLQKYFASGRDVNASKIKPRLERVIGGTWQASLFRLASFTWSVPVSPGFGRRIRFLVWDDHNNKLLGIIAIGDPVFNLSARDNLIGWNASDRANRLVNIMDAYVLGAMPPYNLLLGGKLIACLVRSLEIFQEFQLLYGESRGIISQQQKHASLLAVTTSSSMGRSSVYNRLKLNEINYFESIGYSGGWGHFHVPEDLFRDLRNYVRENGHQYADLHSFGQGPNWRIRLLREALTLLGFKGDLLKHGVKREVFISFLAENSIEVLNGGIDEPKLSKLASVSEISQLASDRWILPRALSRNDYLDWSSESIPQLIKTSLALPRVAVIENIA